MLIFAQIFQNNVSELLGLWSNWRSEFLNSWTRWTEWPFTMRMICSRNRASQWLIFAPSLIFDHLMGAWGAKNSWNIILAPSGELIWSCWAGCKYVYTLPWRNNTTLIVFMVFMFLRLISTTLGGLVFWSGILVRHIFFRTPETVWFVPKKLDTQFWHLQGYSETIKFMPLRCPCCLSLGMFRNSNFVRLPFTALSESHCSFRSMTIQ